MKRHHRFCFSIAAVWNNLGALVVLVTGRALASPSDAYKSVCPSDYIRLATHGESTSIDAIDAIAMYQPAFNPHQHPPLVRRDESSVEFTVIRNSAYFDYTMPSFRFVSNPASDAFSVTTRSSQQVDTMFPIEHGR